MKILVSNKIGNVGKTTIAAHLLSPRMEGAKFFAVETINNTAEDFGVKAEKIRGDEFRKLFKQLIVLDDAIIDVGHSNIESFLNSLIQFDESHLEFDLFLVPLIQGTKEEAHTIEYIELLSDTLGIPAEKIIVVFNKVKHDVEDEFKSIFNFAKRTHKCIANPDIALFENEVFSLAALEELTLTAILNDTNDYKAMVRALGKDGDKKLATQYTNMHAAKALSRAVTRNHDHVFSVIASEA